MSIQNLDDGLFINKEEVVRGLNTISSPYTMEILEVEAEVGANKAEGSFMKAVVVISEATGLVIKHFGNRPCQSWLWSEEW